ncbi:nuclear transport factor 2 family protein [Segnochrobactrum spirostomi]|uniref:Nuclear transport factor 2 family protein n=1 Tax=Segnochrobactrum spirostomi TaxID=2608987 RepID=A0A6A7XZE3_9HYPH|nr:nuclear transport factor 2 family protein [Segnochrobactrum spirostomi]MQT11281.1 nuclear transport factor 2 family protein [Segnochrobactrum spirostomi]
MDPVPKIIEHYITAYNGRDVAAMLRCLTDDVHFVNRSGAEITAETVGIEAFAALAEQGVAFFSERRQEVTNAIVGAGHATLKIAYRATVAADLPNGWKAGQEIALEGVSLFTLRADKIAAITDIS